MAEPGFQCLGAVEAADGNVFVALSFLPQYATNLRVAARIILGGAPDAASAPPEVHLLPIGIRTQHFVRGNAAVLLTGETLMVLNCTDRGRQCRQFWSFVFHGIFLSFLCRILRTLAS